VDHSILDVPCATPPDPETYLRAALAWHFGTDTGSPFWLRMATRLDFDPLSDIRTYDDLGMFPNLVDELRDVQVEDFTAGGSCRAPDFSA